MLFKFLLDCEVLRYQHSNTTTAGTMWFVCRLRQNSLLLAWCFWLLPPPPWGALSKEALNAEWETLLCKTQNSFGYTLGIRRVDIDHSCILIGITDSHCLWDPWVQTAKQKKCIRKRLLDRYQSYRNLTGLFLLFYLLSNIWYQSHQTDFVSSSTTDWWNKRFENFVPHLYAKSSHLWLPALNTTLTLSCHNPFSCVVHFLHQLGTPLNRSKKKYSIN